MKLTFGLKVHICSLFQFFFSSCICHWEDQRVISATFLHICQKNLCCQFFKFSQIYAKYFPTLAAWEEKRNIFSDLPHIPTKHSLAFVRQRLKIFSLALSSHLSQIFFCIISAKKFWQKPFKGAEVEVGVSCKLAMAICIGNTWRQEICIGSTRRQECMEEAAKWQLARTPCNLDTLLQETPQGWRSDLN